MSRPEAGEYATYYGTYISKVPDGDIVTYLADQGKKVEEILRAIDPGREEFRYAEGKWSTKELVGHLVDSERVFAVRALAFVRGDAAHWPGMEQNDYVANGRFEKRRLADQVDEFVAHRRSVVTLFRSFDDEQWLRRGTASECEFTVRAVAYVIAGHTDHHMNVLQEKYLKKG